MSDDRPLLTAEAWEEVRAHIRDIYDDYLHPPAEQEAAFRRGYCDGFTEGVDLALGLLAGTDLTYAEAETYMRRFQSGPLRAWRFTSDPRTRTLPPRTTLPTMHIPKGGTDVD